MNCKHLGDALDHWKGRLFELLKGTIHNLHVLPMFTDARDWSDQQIRAYARLLGVAPGCILCRGEPFTTKGRAAYFQDLPLDAKWDLFLDPDTGFAEDGDARHLRTEDLANVLPLRSHRVVLVYQHAYRKRNYVDHCLRRLTTATLLRGCSTFAYDAGSVSMIFVSQRRERIVRLRQRLIALLGQLPRITEIRRVPPSVP